MASAWYNSAKRAIWDSNYTNMFMNVYSDAVYVALITSTYTPNNDTHTVWTDVTNELVATNYVSGGQTLDTKVFTVDTTNDRCEFSAANEVFTSIGNGTNGTFTQIVLWDTTPTSDPLIAHIDVASTLTNGGNITLQWNAEGILQIG